MAAYAGGSVAGSNTLFVGNLAWATTDDDLREFMQTAGTVMSVQVQTHADTGRSKGWALVEYATPDEANFAIQQFNGKEFNGRDLNIRVDRSEIEKLGGVSLFVGNLPWSVKDAELRTLFAAFNPFDAHVKTFQSGRSRGFGLVRVADEVTARQAIESLSGHTIEDRAIEVREDRPRNPDSAPAPRRARNQAAKPAPKPRQPISADPNPTLYVSNLDWNTTDDDLFKHFCTSGSQPLSANVRMSDRSGRSKGWGLVTFPSVEDAERAKDQLNKTDLDGRPISVRFDGKSSE